MLVAPHGGRRPADAPIRDSLKVNDLYTAELTTLLAARTGSYALVNQAGDRNDLDLNRISQVRARASWFLDALVELLSTLVARHDTARVFFIHGWNVVQPVCDLGTGLKQRGGQVVPASKAAAPTLSATFFTDVVLPFRATALTQGIDVALGRRYPAADKDNLMQLFSARFVTDPSPPIRALATLSMQHHVNAVQLELGVGLRWPGAERDRFIDVFCQTLGKHTPLTQGNGQDFPVVPPFQRPQMVLFTGEDEATADSGRVQVGGFIWQSEADGLSISYRGPVMRFSHPQAFIRLEEGLAASWVEPAEITLRLTLPPGFGTPSLPLFLAHLRGEVRLRDRRCALDAWGFLDMLKSEETGRLLPRRLLSLPFGPDLGIFLSWVETPNGPRSSGVIYHHGTPHPVRPEDWELRYTFEQDRPTAFHLSLTPAQPLTLYCSGETVTAIPIVRHAPQGSALAVTFGLSRTTWQGREARGVYEFSERRKDK